MLIITCDTSILFKDSLSFKEFRSFTRSWLKDSFLDKSYVNKETGLKIIVNNAGIKKLTSSFGEVLAHSFTVIPQIIENAMFVKSEPDNRNRPDIIQVLLFKSKVEVNKVAYEVWMYVRHTKTEHQFYDLTIDVKL